MSNELLIKSIVSQDRITANFSDKYLPRYAREGELYVVDGILYIYSDLDGSSHGRWYPLTDQKEIFTFEQEIASNVWTIPAGFHTDNIQIIVYDEEDKVYKGDFTVEINVLSVILTFQEDVSGLVYIVVNKAFDWVTKRFIVDDKKFAVTEDENDNSLYYIEIDTVYLEILKNGNTTFRSDVTIEGASIFDGDQTVNGVLTVFNNFIVEQSAHIKGDLQVDGNTTIEGDLTVKGTTTTVETEQLLISDNVITLNAGTVGVPIENAGFEVDRGDDGILSIIHWDESVDRVIIPNNTSITGNVDITGVTSITGDVSIQGSNVDIASTTLTVSDNVVVLNKGFIGVPTDNVGLDIDRGDEGILPLITFDEINDYVTISVKQGDDSFLSEEISTKPYLADQIYIERSRAEAIENGLDSRLTIVEQGLSDGLIDLQGQIDDEIINRTNADNTLQTNIDAENIRATTVEGSLIALNTVSKTNLVSAINEIHTDHDAEVVRATTAENTLQTNIDLEKMRAEGVENTLQNNIDAEELRARTVEGSLVTLLTTDKSSLVNALNEEITRATNAESVLTSGLTSESDIRELTDNTLQSNIDAEELRATNAETTLQNNINTEELRATTSENTLQTNIDNEATRASGVEGDITSLNTLTQDSLVDAINEVHSDVDGEIARAISIEGGLSTRLTTLETSTQNSATGIQANLDAEVARATGVEGDLSLLDTVDKSNLVSAINEVHTDVDNETTRATLSETTLQTNIDNEATRASGVEGDITSLNTTTQNSLVDAINEVHSDVDGEVVRATGVETTLQNNINVEKSRIDAILNASTADADSFAEIVTLINTIDSSSDASFAAYATANDAVIADILDGTTPVEKANTLTTARTISLIGGVTGSVLFNGGTDVSITATVTDDAHNHIITNIDGLQNALDNKQDAGVYNTNIGTSTNLTTSAANVVGTIEVTEGVITAMSTRELTLLNLGYTGDTDANNYIHPTTTGNKHIPTGGVSDQILRWSSDGTAVWSNEINTWRPVSDSISTTDSNTSASLTAVKSAYDVGNHAHPYAATNGDVAEDFNSSNLVAVTSFKTPIIYDYSDNSYFMDLSNGTTSINCAGQIVSSGDVVAFSDRRLKENIENIPNALDKVLGLNGVTFTRNDVEDKEKRHTGVIAQDVEAVLPEAVTTQENGMKSVSYGNMVGLLIEALKEQQNQINELKSEVKSLKEK